jgi:hypothetical protein
MLQRDLHIVTKTLVLGKTLARSVLNSHYLGLLLHYPSGNGQKQQRIIYACHNMERCKLDGVNHIRGN